MKLAHDFGPFGWRPPMEPERVGRYREPRTPARSIAVRRTLHRLCAKGPIRFILLASRPRGLDPPVKRMSTRDPQGRLPASSRFSIRHTVTS
jgi:hypothetical protein